MSLAVENLVVEYRRNPLGIDVPRPRLSWQLAGDGSNVMQEAYRLQVSLNPDFRNEIVWDSGIVPSGRSVHVEYGGPALQSGTRYYFKVKVWDNRLRETDWSLPGYWETGLLDRREWRAEWIRADLPAAPHGNEPSHYLRKAFALSGKITRARAYATALGLYELWINGNRAGDWLFTPGWTSYARRLQYQTYDITDMLHPGENAIGMVLGAGWYKGILMDVPDRSHSGEYMAALAQLVIEYEDGRSETIATDRDWHSATGPILKSQIYTGETYDARLELGDWSLPHYDAQAWQTVIPFAHGLDRLVAQSNVPCRVTEELQPIGLITTPAGETVLDMGQNMVGWMRFRVEAAAGTVITLSHAEVLDREGNFYNKNLRTASQIVTYICKGGGPEVFEPHFTFQGFRYVRIEGFAGEPAIGAFTGRVIHSDLETTGQFACSHELVNRLQRNIVWSQRGNFLDVPTDCPQRNERLGWLGDAQVFARTAAFNMNAAPFYGKWLKDLLAEQREDGGLPSVVPNTLGDRFYSSSAWGDAAVICPWILYLCYGDTRVLREHYDSMKAWVAYIRDQGDNAYLWNTGFHFGDWLALDAPGESYVGATPTDLIATAFYAHSTDLLAKVAHVLGEESDAAQYRELHRRIVEAFGKEFVTPSGRLASPTQTAHVLALMFGLLEENAAAKAAQTLEKLIEEKNGHLTTGFLGTPYLCHVLTANGRNDLAYRLLLQESYPSWLYEVAKGATTVWEHWDGIREDGSICAYDMNSYNHYAYGSIGEWLYRVVAGIDTDETESGYKKIRFAPRPGPGLTSVKASLRSMYGIIRSNWTLDEHSGKVLVELEIPHNTTATVLLPGIHMEVGSGRHKFEYEK